MTFSLEGPDWKTKVVTWSFETSGVSTLGGTAYSDPVTNVAQQQLIEAAMADWQSHTGVTLEQVADSANSLYTPDIRVGLGDLLGGTALDGNEIGVTQIYYYPSSNSLVPGVTVQLQDPAQTPLAPDASGTLIYQNSSTSFYQVALHEIGHALGLGHDTDPTAVMYPTATPSNRDLSGSDIAGIQSLYGPNTGANADESALYLHGAYSQYTLAQNGSGTLLVQDNVGGRDGSTAIVTDQIYLFTDGVALSDPTGYASDVDRLYHAVLGRGADLGGLIGDTSAANGGTSLDQIAQSMVGSQEYAQHFSGLSDMQFIETGYQNTFGRAADAGGLASWMGALQNGDSRAQVLDGLAQSQEARADYQTVAGDHDNAEVTRLYGAALDRAPDATGLASFAGALDQGSSVAAIAQGLVGSPEFQSGYGSLSNNDFLNALYRNTLGRAPDAAGLAGWNSQLAQGASRATVIVAFADSQENRLLTASVTHDGSVFLPNG